MTNKPQFLVLSAGDCQELLGRLHLGRLAFVHDGRVDIEPLGYVFKGSWLFLRSAYGTKIEAFEHNPYVAFEVDEAKGPFDWRSVVAHGTIYMLPPDGAPLTRREYQRALKALRSVIPETLTADDPAPTRQIVYGLHIDRLTGRMALSAPVPPLPRRVQPTRRSAQDAEPSDRF